MTAATLSSAAWLADKLGARPDGNGWLAPCPAHDDAHPSFAIDEGDGGRVLFVCRAGCSQANVLNALIDRGAWPPPMSVPGGVASGNGNGTGRRGAGARWADRIRATYDYRDEKGALLFQVVRIEPGDDGRSKDFCQRRPDPAGRDGWTWKTQGIRRVPYRLPELLAAPPLFPVYVAEGEKDVAALVGLGLVATCNSGGAGKWRHLDRDAVAKAFAGRRVVVVADKDAAGRDHAADVAARLADVAADVRVLELPDRDGKSVKDAHDFVAAGGTRADIEALAAAATKATAAPASAPAPSTRSPRRWDPDSFADDERVILVLADRTDEAPGARDARGFSKEHAARWMPVRDRLLERGSGLSDDERQGVAELARIYGRQLKDARSTGELGTEAPTLIPRAALAILASDPPRPVTIWGRDENRLVVAGEPALIYSREGVGKSWIALGLGVAVASGAETFLGFPVARSPVLLVSPEMGAWFERRRLELVLNGRAAPEQLHILGREAAALDLAQPAHLAALEKAAVDVKAGLVVIDPLSAAWIGEETNVELGRLTRALNRFAATTGAAVLITHHENKLAGAGKADDDAAFRGGTALRAGVRVAVRIVREPATGGLKIRVTKTNVGATPDELYIAPGEPWLFNVTEAPKGDAEAKPVRMTALRTWLLTLPEGAPVTAAAALAAMKDCGEREVKEGAARTYLKELVGELLAPAEKGKSWTRHTPQAREGCGVDTAGSD